jgi:Rrf2 family protein
MLSMPKKAEYGLLFLSELAQSDRESYVSVKKVAKENKIPYEFLAKIASSLKEMGIVESKEGVGGGYRLSMNPNDIPLGSVIEHLDGPVAPVACMRGGECTCSESCGHKDVMEKVSTAVQTTLDDYSLADLVKKGK